MSTVRRINVSQIEGGNSTDSDKRPNGEIALYDDSNDGFDLVIHDGQNSTSDNRVLGKGKFYGHGKDSGDGNLLNTIKLIPDVSIYENGSHQYIIVDPTAPSHIHLRAGGDIDSSNAEIFLGGENNNFRVSDYGSISAQTTGSFGITTDSDTNSHYWQFNEFGILVFPDSTTQSTAWSGGRVVSNPTTSIGLSGDKLGDISFSSTHLYYCTQNYDGVSNIWKRILWSGDTW
jgi:hypothetical protein